MPSGKNKKPEYLRKLLQITTPGGYKFDIANYLYNPAFGNEYPAFIKTISETETETTRERIYYFKYYNGTGEYKRETWTATKDPGNVWSICRNRKEETLGSSRRFNLDTLLSFCT